MREYYLPFRLSNERLQRLSAALTGGDSRINTDLSPVCYFYDAVLWSKQFKDVSSKLLSVFARISPSALLLAVGALFVAAAFIQRTFPKAWGEKSILIAVGTTGFAEITTQVVTLLGFQAIYGYVYYKIAVIVTCFMIGLACGAAMVGKWADLQHPRQANFLIVQAMVCLYPLVLLAMLLMMTRGGFQNFVHADVIFPALALLAGFVGGLQFPLANALWLSRAPGTARAAGFTYGVDLLGSFLGALLTTALLVPVFGIAFACIAAAALNLGSLLLLLAGSRRHPVG